MAEVKYDVAVIGGGPAGLAIALALSARLGAGGKIVLIDGPPPRPNPARVFALAPASQRFFAELGVWPQMQPSAAPVLGMVIMDGDPDDPIRRKELAFSGSEDAPLAHLLAADAIVDALQRRLSGADVARIASRLERIDGQGAIAKLTLADGQVVPARLAVAADGGDSTARQAAGIASVEWSYRQIAMVATIEHARPHGGVAEQVFFPSGPFATLPLPGNRSSIVWSEGAAAAEALLAGPHEDFLRELEKRFPARLGEFSLSLPPQGFPLAFRLARRFVAARLALVGDAAHRVHPLAGQGLNLGLRDVAALVAAVAEALSLGLDPGDAQTLAGYERSRRFDVAASGLGMDAMNRLFSNRSSLLHIVRDFGLRLVDRAPLIKDALVREAEGV